MVKHPIIIKTCATEILLMDFKSCYNKIFTEKKKHWLPSIMSNMTISTYYIFINIYETVGGGYYEYICVPSLC